MSPDAIAGSEGAGELRLASGRLVKLRDVRLPADTATPARADDWLASLKGAAVDVAASPAKPDRWGRVAAALTLREGAIDVAELLVAEGLAIVSVEEQTALCRPDLLELEARARGRRHGLWAEAAWTPLAATELALLQERIGRFALVEGRVRSVGERAARTYLNFGAFGEPGFTVTVPKRVWSRLRDRGMSAETLRGRRVRVRGLLESWRGVAMEIVVGSMLEVLDDKRP